ncbi:hypothetical protein chiPu_0029489 [Chiloscyllium punctatum]|uniref:Uncharacterized protein n=1 Tax=Chiloscyllium punctatum TaxID=137246 RepID=A0A401TRE2_CHIPU|nr:hypothetical protein [Chiloscyllium punctatum]
MCFALELFSLLLMMVSFYEQAPVPLGGGDSRSSVRFADDDDYLDTAGFAEEVGEQRGARASLLPNFGRPLDRIFSEKRLIHGDRPAPR